MQLSKVFWATKTELVLKNSNSNSLLGPKQVEEFLNVVGIIFPIKHWNCAVLRLIIRTILVFYQNHHSNEILESFYTYVSKGQNYGGG